MAVRCRAIIASPSARPRPPVTGARARCRTTGLPIIREAGGRSAPAFRPAADCRAWWSPSAVLGHWYGLVAVLVRYRYRLCPSPGQRQALARACNDARRACRNWFDSLSGKRNGRKVGHPRFRRKRGRQSIRLTRSGFTLRDERLYVAKVGEMRVRWSRDLASAPSSVTVIREPDGRYYASFVVEREAVPLPASGREIGLDVGLDRLAVTSEGEVIANPRFLRRRERRLARAQRALSRKARGSANRAKARHRVAVLHRKVRETRLDHAHKTALRLVRDNQAVYAEDLAVSGLARIRLAKSIHDAAWAQLLRLVAEKAEHHGRTFHRIGRFEPTSQVCSACGIKDGPKPLSIRTWTCTACSTVHDRDVDAALNILAAGRDILAAGRADRLNACRAQVRPGPALAQRGEAGTHRSAT
jgi:putative transposase